MSDINIEVVGSTVQRRCKGCGKFSEPVSALKAIQGDRTVLEVEQFPRSWFQGSNEQGKEQVACSAECFATLVQEHADV